jgi:RHS repeat-associated protein
MNGSGANRRITMSAIPRQLRSATAYDPLNRLEAFIRGTLSSSGDNGSSLDAVANASINTAANSDESWTLDALGNWISSGTAAGTGTVTAPSLTSTARTNNSQNETTAIGATSLTYNHNGEMLTDASNNYFYDAWGDELSSTSGTSVSYPIEDYAYDALGRPISETTYTSSSCSTTHNLYYSQAGQVTDDIHAVSMCTISSFCCCGSFCYCCCTTSTIDDQQISGAGYVDDLVRRDETTTTHTTYSDSTGYNYSSTTSAITRLYVQQDANYNVTALTNTSGAVQERFVYDPYGNQQVLSASWSSTSDAYNWIYGFQGGRTDVSTGLVHFGARDYSPTDGRWVEPDPAGYVDGANRFQFEHSVPDERVDPIGCAGQNPMPNTVYAPLLIKLVHQAHWVNPDRPGGDAEMDVSWLPPATDGVIIQHVWFERKVYNAAGVELKDETLDKSNSQYWEAWVVVGGKVEVGYNDTPDHIASLRDISTSEWEDGFYLRPYLYDLKRDGSGCKGSYEEFGEAPFFQGSKIGESSWKPIQESSDLPATKTEPNIWKSGAATTDHWLLVTWDRTGEDKINTVIGEPGPYSTTVICG